jgi:hypothetical protein
MCERDEDGMVPKLENKNAYIGQQKLQLIPSVPEGVKQSLQPTINNYAQ